MTGAFRTDGLLRGLGGIIAGAFTTTARNAIATGVGLAPYGTQILNTTTNQYEWNKGDDTTRNWQAFGSSITSGVDVLANRPSAASVAAGSTYFATDQVVQYVSTGATWIRTSAPAGATVGWYAVAAVPAGWVAYDGGNLSASTGIYADLYAHLGNTVVTPDTKGRMTVGQGSHADVATIGANDGLAVGTRTPKHNSTHGVTVTGAPALGSLAVSGAPTLGTLAVATVGFNDNGPGDVGATGGHTQGPGTTTGGASGVSQHTHGLTGVPGIGSLVVSGAPTIGSLAAGGSIGPGGTRPVDTGAYIVALKIAKL